MLLPLLPLLRIFFASKLSLKPQLSCARSRATGPIHSGVKRDKMNPSTTAPTCTDPAKPPRASNGNKHISHRPRFFCGSPHDLKNPSHLVYITDARK